MSFLDSFLNKIKLTDDDYDDDYDDYEEEEDYEEEDTGKKKGFFKFGRSKDEDEDEEEEESISKLTPMRGGKSSAKMQIEIIKPTGFNDVKDIADALLSNVTIVLNMEGLDLSTAQRIIDFMTGACYSIDGNLQKISNYMFILTPNAVRISGDIQNLADAFEAAANGGTARLAAY